MVEMQAESESDVAFVERMGRSSAHNYDYVIPKKDRRRLIALARRAASMPDAGAEDVERVARALCIFDRYDPDETGDSHDCGVPRDWPLWRIYEPKARAALAAMPRRDDRAGLLRAVQILKDKDAEWSDGGLSFGRWPPSPGQTLWALVQAIEAEALRTPTPEQGEQEGWRPIETAPREHVLIFCLLRGEPTVTEGYHYDGGKWHAAAFNGTMPRVYPTHWMPLPAAPRASK